MKISRGDAEMILEYIRDGDVKHSTQVRSALFTVGSAPHVDVRIREKGMPAELCRVERVPGREIRWRVRFSDQLPMIGGERVDVNAGQVVQFDTLRLRFRSDDFDANSCSGCGDPLDAEATLCVACGLNRRTGKYVDPPGFMHGAMPPMASDPAPGFAWQFREEAQRDDVAVSKDDRRIAAVRMLGAAAMFAAAVLSVYLHVDRDPPLNLPRYLVGTTLTVIVHTGLLMGVLLLANAFGNIEFGRADHALFKCFCVAAAVSAAQIWITPFVTTCIIPPGAAGGVAMLASSRIIALISAFVALLLPVSVMKWLFGLDLGEFAMVFVFQMVVLFVATVIAALL